MQKLNERTQILSDPQAYDCNSLEWSLVLIADQRNNYIWQNNLAFESIICWIKNKSSFGFSDVLLVLNNWSIQKSSDVENLKVNLKWRVMHLPVYSPIYAPIENWFGLIKTHMKNENNSDSIKKNLKQNYDKIFYALKSIKSQTIKNLFANLFSRIREKLTNLSQWVQETYFWLSKLYCLFIYEILIDWLIFECNKNKKNWLIDASQSSKCSRWSKNNSKESNKDIKNRLKLYSYIWF